MMTPSVRTGSPRCCYLNLRPPRARARLITAATKKVQPHPVIRYVETRVTRVVACVCRSTGETTRRSHLCLHSRNAAGEAAGGPVYTHMGASDRVAARALMSLHHCPGFPDKSFPLFLAFTSSPFLRTGQHSSGHEGWRVRTAARRKDEMSAGYSMLKRVVIAATLWEAY